MSEPVWFDGPEGWRAWLQEHHETADEVWLGMYKKHSPRHNMTWSQAVDEALCFGWIDSVSQRIDDDARRQRWTPRKPGSNWSAINIALVEKLTAEGRMHPAGIAAFERRREDRSGVYSFENPPADLPPEVEQELRRLAVRAFEALSCEGLARVDFFVLPDHSLIINELNTMPGFTPTSMFPQMWAETGVSYPELVDRLITLALERETGLR